MASKQLAWSPIVLALLAITSVASATVMVEIPLEQMVHDADAIVLGTVERTGVRLQVDERGATPHTLTFVRVRESLEGTAQPGELVVIDEVGGVMGDRGMRIDGTPTYRRGEEIVVFLERTTGERFRTLQMCQGHFEILRGVPGFAEDIVQRDLSAVGLASWDAGAMTIEHGGRRAMALDDFLAWVRSAVEQTRIAAPPGSGSSGAIGGAR